MYIKTDKSKQTIQLTFRPWPLAMAVRKLLLDHHQVHLVSHSVDLYLNEVIHWSVFLDLAGGGGLFGGIFASSFGEATCSP